MIGGVLNRLLFRPVPPRGPAYAAAMVESGDLLMRMRDAAASRDPARALLADIWQQRHNIPFMTTIHEAVAEMRSPIDGTEGRAPKKGSPPR